eukprot:CAMPEP_0194250270 /NCGR_PEP_ID=MMETSP0158-20130606/22574_1 /TAXON_ID=33649 /ORGANISM="Thalassionema nitzschioides, Strain L26-B" /LENGTH=277 /DNA_ID=CAMNT_0038987009 /DNA_START=139 /DNA_END=969 /DNA_ORIENTATION=-
MEHDKNSLFVEIRPNLEKELKPQKIEVLTSAVDPKLCRQLLTELSKVSNKDITLAHLKRVKRHQQDGQESNNVDADISTKKPQKKLEVLLGRTEEGLSNLVDTYNLQLERRLVPGRPAVSLEELKEFNSLWPTIYFHKNSEEYKESELTLSSSEIEQMEFGMKQALKDDAVVIDPLSGSIVSRAKDELLQQPNSVNNPLSSPVILAIQGVSRKERELAIGLGMESGVFRDGQYLCTGYDMYLRNEPNVYEAMALVHSRIRRVVFEYPNSTEGGVGGT